MAIKKNLIITADTKSAVSDVDNLNKSLDQTTDSTDNLNEATEEATGLFDKMTNGAVSGLKGVVKGVRAGVVAMTTLKGAIIATGIGALLVAVTSLVSYFTRTQRGAEKLRVIMAALGAFFDVFLDKVGLLGESLVSVFENPKQSLMDFANLIKDNIVNRFEGLLELLPALGKAITLLFEGEFSEAGQVAVDAVAKVTLGVEDMTQKTIDFIDTATEGFQEITKEIEQEVKAAIDLENALNRVKREERSLRVERAKGLADINEQKRIAEDVTKGFEERIQAAQKAADLEDELLEKELRNEAERLRILKAQAALGESDEETLDAIADQEVTLANLREQSLTRQIELNNKINSIKNEQINKEKADQAEADRIEQEREDKKLKQAEEEKQRQDKELAEKKQRLQEELDFQKVVEDTKIGLAQGTLGVINSFTTEGSDLQKGVAVAQATIDTYKAATNALANVPAPFNFAAAAVTVAAGLANVRKILSVDPSGQSVTAPSGGTIQSAQISAPSVNVTGGNAQLNQIAASINNNNNTPIRTYVVSSEVTSEQQLDTKIKNGAKFG